jgi:5-oxoprolinase (ATP-hydrolysing)
VSILSERRAFQPYGLEGGDPGSRGMNLLTYKQDARVVNLGGKNTVKVSPGDRLAIYTPGGGGFGLESLSPNEQAADVPAPRLTGGSLNQYILNQESV